MVEKLIELYLMKSHDEIVRYFNKDLNDFHHIHSKEDYFSVYIPKSPSSKVMPVLCAHTDTWFSSDKELRIEDIIISQDIITTSADCNRGLGGDDRNGVYILSEIIKTNPDDYIFALFNYEERINRRSGIERGATKSVKLFDSIKNSISCFISVDRCETYPAIYGAEHKEILHLLVQDFGYYVRGTGTDAGTLAQAFGISCFNLLAGYTMAHTMDEKTIVSRIVETVKYLNKLKEMHPYLWERAFPREVI